ncbi:MAG: hypothetical protein R3B99_02770 [Polyangiales bacterium]
MSFVFVVSRGIFAMISPASTWPSAGMMLAPTGRGNAPLAARDHDRVAGLGIDDGDARSSRIARLDDDATRGR